MRFLEIIDKEHNFWELYPELKIDVFYELLRTEGADRSSKIMWAVAYYADVYSPYRNLRIEDRMAKVEVEFEVKREEIEHLVKEYNELQRTSPEYALKVFDEQLHKRTAYMQSLDYESSVGLIEDMMASTAKIVSQRDDIIKSIERENERIKRGGGSASYIAAMHKNQTNGTHHAQDDQIRQNIAENFFKSLDERGTKNSRSK